MLYKIKRGESEHGYDFVIASDIATQLIISFYLEEPYRAHLKTQLVSDSYNRIFSRSITAGRIFLSYMIHKVIEGNLGKIENDAVGNYGLAIFAILRCIKEILSIDPKGKELIENPDEEVSGNFDLLNKAFTELLNFVLIDVNAFIAEYISDHEGFFDYKNLFKSKDFISRMLAEVIKGWKRALVRNPEDSFERIFEKLSNEINEDKN